MFWGHLSVCLYMYVGMHASVTVESLDVESLLLVCGDTVKFVYEDHRVNVKVIKAKKLKKSLFPQCKTSIGNKSGSTEDSAVKFACSVGYWAMADRMTPSLSRDRKYTHSRVVCLRLEGNLVVSL